MPAARHASSNGVSNTGRLISYAEAAKRLAISPRTLQRAAAVGELRIARFGHRTVRVSEEDLAAWVAGHTNFGSTNKEE